MTSKPIKDFRPLIKRAEEQGWLLQRTRGSGHFRLKSPEGQQVFFAATPSCRRAVLNLRSVLRRAGVDC